MQATLERPEHQRPGAVLQLLAHRLLGGGDVIFRGGREGEGRLQQRLAAQLEQGIRIDTVQ